MLFDTYPEAVTWVRGHWTDVQVPFRLHTREIGDDGAPKAAEALWRYLCAQADDRLVTTFTQDCSHWRLPLYERLLSCPDCGGRGTFEKTVERWLYPMRHALSQLQHVKAQSAAMPRPIVVVMAGAAADWHLAMLAETLQRGPEITEWLVTLALRNLRERYTEGPVPVRGWISGRSDAQRNAEAAIA